MSTEFFRQYGLVSLAELTEPGSKHHTSFREEMVLMDRAFPPDLRPCRMYSLYRRFFSKNKETTFIIISHQDSYAVPTKAVHKITAISDKLNKDQLKLEVERFMEWIQKELDNTDRTGLPSWII